MSNEHLEKIELEVWRLYRMGKIEASERDPVIEHVEAMAADLEEAYEEIETLNRHWLVANLRLEQAGLPAVGYGDVTDKNYDAMLDNHGDIPESEGEA